MNNRALDVGHWGKGIQYIVAHARRHMYYFFTLWYFMWHFDNYESSLLMRWRKLSSIPHGVGYSWAGSYLIS